MDRIDDYKMGRLELFYFTGQIFGSGCANEKFQFERRFFSFDDFFYLLGDADAGYVVAPKVRTDAEDGNPRCVIKFLP